MTSRADLWHPSVLFNQTGNFPGRSCCWAAILAILQLCSSWPCVVAQSANRHDTLLDEGFRTQVIPLLVRYCHDCHSGQEAEASVDLVAFPDFASVQQQSETWVKIEKMLARGEMPPQDSPQPTAEEFDRLRSWLRSFLEREARANAGDPGPVTLRRLNNQEYNFTVRDLTGLDSLNPTREFPVDGAAGEGFINAGAAQSMSPALVGKYLDAAKEVAAHAVLLPDGIEFSRGTSQPERTAERIQAIRNFYDRFTVGTAVNVNVDGTGDVANQGGAIPLAEYLAAALEQRHQIRSGQSTPARAAAARSLNPKYMGLLWQSLNAPPRRSAGPLMRGLRARWRTASPGDIPELTEYIRQFQNQLWEFNSIGQLTEGGKQKIWMQPKSPLVTRQDVRFPIPDMTGQTEFSLFLRADDLGDGRNGDFVVWDQPRFVFKPDDSGFSHPPILLRDIPGLIQRINRVITTELSRTSEYLRALSECHDSERSLEEIAKARRLNMQLLNRWSELVRIDSRTNRAIHGHLTRELKHVSGFEEINGWGRPATPNLLTNRAETEIRFSTVTVPPRSVVMHPSPTQESVVAWQSPINGKVKLNGLVADADAVCGNGAAWRIELLTTSGHQELVAGQFENGGRSEIQATAELDIRRGDIISLIVNSRDQSHVCDTTHVALKIREVGGGAKQWDLATDVVDRILESNPLVDSYGHPGVWHFCASSVGKTNLKPALVPGSTLAHWRAAVVTDQSAETISRLVEAVQNVVTTEALDSLSAADRKFQGQACDWKGIFQWTTVAAAAPLASAAVGDDWMEPGLDFGKHPNGSDIGLVNLCIQAPRLVKFRLPAALVAGSEFVASVRLHAETSREGSVQLKVASTTHPREAGPVPGLPILISENSQVQANLENDLTEFRQLFPPALCYSRIVPVDEVVTLTLYFREDDQLQRLMLDDSQIAELEQLWDELLYVAREPLALSVAMEQIYEFATQDRPDLVKVFGPMREPIKQRADQFRKRLRETEPVHVESVVQFAEQAWRRPLTPSERQGLHDLYGTLRESGLSHDQSIRLNISRVLTSPAFLYRLEQPAAGMGPASVSGIELVNRLSYFLWSSMPDAELRRLAESDRLPGEEILLAQVRRMLKDPRTRRLATQFACQWLHLRDFDQNDDKNEKLYPEFADLRDDMYEETVRFFADLFQNDGSILDILDAEHTFLNPSLAAHYGIADVAGPGWQRVENIRGTGRGGILGMASVLSSQSGASRTSPILRGNWVYETLLGERLPRPPTDVPQLPNTIPEGLTARQLIERHTLDPACAKCHKKIDPFGFALEKYDAIGRLRQISVDTRTTLDDGTELEGIEGLRKYLMENRRQDFVRQFCRKLLGFALGREVQLSDEMLLDRMQNDLAENGYRFSVAVEAIVNSRQFRQIRGQAIAKGLPSGGNQ